MNELEKITQSSKRCVMAGLQINLGYHVHNQVYNITVINYKLTYKVFLIIVCIFKITILHYMHDAYCERCQNFYTVIGFDGYCFSDL